MRKKPAKSGDGASGEGLNGARRNLFSNAAEKTAFVNLCYANGITNFTKNRQQVEQAVHNTYSLKRSASNIRKTYAKFVKELHGISRPTRVG